MSDESQNTPSRQVPLKERVKTWPGILKECDFAGQIDLSEDDLRSLAPVVRGEFESPVAAPHRHATRVVFSVNCAYYAHDGGFWEYFCKHINYENTAQNQGWLGEKIEQSLLHFGFLEKPGYGAYRYVGPLIGQAGATLRSMPQFADILREAASGDWDHLRSLTFHLFRRVVSRFPGTYLALFLNDDSQTGWRFARAVATNISQYERGLLSWKELQELPGYRPGFWKELKRHLDIAVAPHEENRSQGAPLPRLIFDPATQQVQLTFDHGCVERRLYFFDGGKVDSAKWPLTRREDFKRSYGGLIRRENNTAKEFQIPGWSLDAAETFAIFHPSKGYVAHDAPVPLGPCYLLAPQGTRLPDAISPLTDFEHVSIADAQYVFWQIDVTLDTNLQPFGYTQERRAQDILSWAFYGSRLMGSLEPTEVFLEQLPPIRVAQAHLFRQNRLALFLQTGSDSKRIMIAGDSDTEEATIQLQAPCNGRIWVEQLGRLRATEAAPSEGSLAFTLLPKCELRWPSGLFSPDAQPQLTFEGPPQFSADFPGCSVAGPGTWRVPVQAPFVEGTLHIQHVSLLLGRTIYRAEFSHESDPTRRFFEPSDFDTDFQLRLRGLPGAQIRLGLSNTADTLAFDLAQTFDTAGLKRISSFSVRDVLKNYSEPAGIITIWDGRSWVQTGSGLLNLRALRCWLFEEHQHQAAPWLQYLESTFSAWLVEVRQGLPANAPARQFQVPITLPSATQKWADEIELMLFVFAVHGPGESADPFALRKTAHLDPEMLKALRWVWSARGLVERGKSEDTSDASTLISQYPQWLPSRTAWLQTMQDLLEKLRLQHDLAPMLAEWAAEARPPMRIVLSSRIASQARGRDLTEAYIRSQQGNHHAAYQITDAIERGSPSGLILDLALLLKNILLVRNNLAFNSPRAAVHQKLQPYFHGLSQLADGHPVTPPSDGMSNLISPEQLPLHADDIALLCRAIGVVQSETP